MNFRDIGIIINKRKLGESTYIVSLLTNKHGLHSGVARSSSQKSSSTYQEGNLVDFFWQARLHEHIGTAKCELIKSYGALLITNKTNLYAFNSIVSLIKLAFHEREPHNNFFAIFHDYLNKLSNKFNFYEYIKLELAILNEAGYKLELDYCAAAHTTENLCYVSPKTGRAISKEAGLPFADKLLALPSFLTAPNAAITPIEQSQAFNLTSYFFNRYFFHDQQPLARKMLIRHLQSGII